MKMTFCSTSDVDQDGVATGSERDELRWTSVDLIPRLAEVMDARGVRTTWFVRADNQLEDVYGTPAYLLERFDALWQTLTSARHAIAWHPHVYRREGERYVVETDGGRCADQLRRIHPRLPRPFHAVRMGEAFHSNESMAALDSLGLRVDSTAIPGRSRRDAARVFDWEVTTNAPYRPSRNDYRAPGADSLSILEVPMTSIPILAPYDSSPLRRYINLAFRQDLLLPRFESYLDSLDRTSDHVLVTIVHPEEIRPTGNPLYGDGLGEVERNLDALLARMRERGDVEIRTMDEL
jgi:hypothetical protein